jgi:hypothetical protein
MVGLLCPLGCMICPLHSMKGGCRKGDERYQRFQLGGNDCSDGQNSIVDEYSIYSKKTLKKHRRSQTNNKKKRNHTKKKRSKQKNEKQQQYEDGNDETTLIHIHQTAASNDEMTTTTSSTDGSKSCSVSSTTVSRLAAEEKLLDKQGIIDDREGHPTNNCDDDPDNFKSLGTYQDKQEFVSLVDHLQQNRNYVYERMAHKTDPFDTTDSDSSIDQNQIIMYVPELLTTSDDDTNSCSVPDEEVQSETSNDGDGDNSSSYSNYDDSNSNNDDEIISQSDSFYSAAEVSPMLPLVAAAAVAEEDVPPIEEALHESGGKISQESLPLVEFHEEEQAIEEARPILMDQTDKGPYSALGDNWLGLLHRARLLQQRVHRYEKHIPPTITIENPPTSKRRDVSPDDSSGTEVTAVSTLASSKCSSFSSCSCKKCGCDLVKPTTLLHSNLNCEKQQSNMNGQPSSCCTLNQNDNEKYDSNDYMTSSQTQMNDDEIQEINNMRAQLMVETMMFDDSNKFRDAIEYIRFMSRETKGDSSRADNMDDDDDDDDCSSISCSSLSQDMEPVDSSESAGFSSCSDNYEIDDYREETENNDTNKYPFKLIHRSHNHYENNCVQRNENYYGGAFCESDEDEHDFQIEFRAPTRMETIREEPEDDMTSRNTCSTDSIAYEVNRFIQKMRQCSTARR